MNTFTANIIAAMDVTTIIGIVVLGLLLVALFVYPSLTNKKRQKQINQLYSSVEVGDKIKTVGGIIGTVLSIREINALENEFVLETGEGDNKTTMVFDMQAVYQNITKQAQSRAATMDSTSQPKEEIPEESQEAEQEVEQEDAKN